GLAARVHVTVTGGTPAPLDPDVAVTPALPAALLPDVADALALPVAVAPLPPSARPHPAAFDPHEARARRGHHDDARRGRLLLDLDVRDRRTHVPVSTHDTAGPERHDGDEGGATESVFQRHIRS